MKKYIKTAIALIFSAVICLFSPLAIYDGTVYAADNVNFYQKEIKIASDGSTDFYNSFFSKTPEIVSFIDCKGFYNVVSYVEPNLYIYRYDKNLKLKSEVKIKGTYNLFGNIVCDDSGNYYVCWGREDLSNDNITVLSVTKYDYSGNILAEILLNGYDLANYSPAEEWGTRIPFDAGTCSMAINNGILACNFAREMYCEHQSNYVFYIDCSNMTRVYEPVPYCSHSFSQDCIATSDGGFLMANHGDAYSRGFLVSKIDCESDARYDKYTFHFREGTNRDFGYNETYAQLGGLTETENTYVLCASSERTLSLDVAPTKDYYCSYSEARDLFVQILKKDFYDYAGAESYYVTGEERELTGSKPESAETELYLTEDVMDYGVVWLTEYNDECFAANPKVVTVDGNRILVMWEKRTYDNLLLKGTYYMILSEDGSVYKKATKIGNVSLPSDADIVFYNNNLFWTTSGEESFINVLNISEHKYTYTVTKESTCTKSGSASYICTDCCDVWSFATGIAVKKKDHSYKTATEKATLTKNGKTVTKCTACGKISKTTAIYYPKSMKLSKTSYTYNGKKVAPSVTIKDSKGKKLKKDTDYTVKYEKGRKSPGKYTVKIVFKGKYKGTKRLYFTIKPSVTGKITATQTTSSITLKWRKVTGADSYIVYKYNSKSKKYVKVKEVAGTALKITGLKSGVAYKYKIRTVRKDEGDIIGGYSSVFETATKCSTPKIKKISSSKGKVTLNWTDVAGEKGYQLYYSGKKDSGYKKVKSYKAKKGSISKLKKGKKYYFKVRAYKKTSSGTVYSSWSKVKSIKVK